MFKLSTLITIALFSIHCLNSKAQERTYTIHTLAFYNLENFFDPEDDPEKFDESSPIMEIKSNREVVYQEKTNNMALAISEIGLKTTGNAPVVLGLAEIENRRVLEDLINHSLLLKHNFGIIHFDSPDSRGIDIALLYQKALFFPKNAISYPLHIKDSDTGKPVYTRDLLVVSGQLDGELIHLIVNHWPSRRGGESRSNYKRIAAAKMNKHIIDSLQTQNPYAKIISMGDFNDDPINDSFKNILKTKSESASLNLKELFNPMDALYKKGFGTTAYRDKWSLFDQIFISKPLTDKDFNTYQFYKAGIFNPLFLTTASGPYKGYPFRSFSSEGFTGGYSDHFPVYMYVIKATDSP